MTPDASIYWLSVDLHKHVVLGYCVLTDSVSELDNILEERNDAQKLNQYEMETRAKVTEGYGVHSAVW